MARPFSPKALAGVLLLGLLLTTGTARAQWSNVKGRIVWGGAALPVPVVIAVGANRDAAFCLKNGPVVREEKVVNPKNKGVRWVVVWLADLDEPKTKGPSRIHPALAKAKPQEHVLDQPCCAFEPHVLAMRGGDTLVAKNSATIAHNSKVSGGLLGPNLNPVLLPGQSKEIPNIRARRIPIIITCGLHPWMKAYVKVFDHPYFAVTDKDGNFSFPNAPAGKYRLVAWEESVGYILGKNDHGGVVIEIKAKGATDLGELKMNP